MVIEYHEAAFAHQTAEADIEWALRTQFFERPAADGSYLTIGFNRAGNPLEVAYRELMTDHYLCFTLCRAVKSGLTWQMKGENMAKRPTDEETWALQKMWTENPPELLEGTGPLTRRRDLLRLLDDVSANYILTISEREHKTPSQVVGDIIREKVMTAAQ